jgi:hypothetical protein
MTYAGKIVAKASLKQHRAKEKVRRPDCHLPFE